MSTKLPLQSKAVKTKFERRSTVFGDDDDVDENFPDEFVVGLENNQVKEAQPKPKETAKSIAPLANMDWRTAAKRKRELFIPTRAQSTTTETNTEIFQQDPNSFGLQIQQKKVQIEHKQIEKFGESEQKESRVEVFTETIVPEDKTVMEEKFKSLEESAIEALIKESRGETEVIDKGPAKVIPLNETISFRNDVENRPDEMTIDDYENMPVDEFGAALLRGLGWNEGEGIGRNRKNALPPPTPPVKQREALLGLGAKPEDIEKDAKSKYKNRREAYQYKDTSLFKKISKKKYEDDYTDKQRSRNSSRGSSRGSSRDSERSGSRQKYIDKYDDKYDDKYNNKKTYDDKHSKRSNKLYDDKYDDKYSSKSSKRTYDSNDDQYIKSSKSSKKRRYDDDNYIKDKYRDRESTSSTRV